MNDIVTASWSALSARHKSGAFESFDAAYREPHRAYHAWRHIAELLEKLNLLHHLAVRADLVATAIFWHDAVYLTRDADGRFRPDAENVRDSAALFARYGALDAPDMSAVQALILATTHSGGAETLHEIYPGFRGDLALFLDLDLSPLAAQGEAFRRNEEDIRFEYNFVPEDAYCRGRIAVMQSLLRDGDPVFRRQETRALWEDAARANIRGIIEELRASLRRVT